MGEIWNIFDETLLKPLTRQSPPWSYYMINRYSLEELVEEEEGKGQTGEVGGPQVAALQEAEGSQR